MAGAQHQGELRAQVNSKVSWLQVWACYEPETGWSQAAVYSKMGGGGCTLYRGPVAVKISFVK